MVHTQFRIQPNFTDNEGLDMLSNKTAIITGAGSGIGKAIALHLAASQARVVVADLNESSAGETAAEIIEKGGKALAAGCDVANESSVDESPDAVACRTEKRSFRSPAMKAFSFHERVWILSRRF